MLILGISVPRAEKIRPPPSIACGKTTASLTGEAMGLSLDGDDIAGSRANNRLSENGVAPNMVV